MIKDGHVSTEESGHVAVNVATTEHLAFSVNVSIETRLFFVGAVKVGLWDRRGSIVGDGRKQSNKCFPSSKTQQQWLNVYQHEK